MIAVGAAAQYVETYVDFSVWKYNHECKVKLKIRILKIFRLFCNLSGVHAV